MNWSLWLSRSISAIVSLIQAASLRDRYYTLEQRLELVNLAIEDIERINANSANPNPLIASICTRICGSTDQLL